MERKIKELIERIETESLDLVNCASLSMGDSIAYSLKTILDIMNSQDSCEVVILRKKKEKTFLDLQKGEVPQWENL